MIHRYITVANMKKVKVPHRNYLVRLVMIKKGAGRHKDKKREAKNKHF